MTAKHLPWFGIVQTLGIMLMAVSNIHTNVLPFIVGYILLAPGIFVTTKLDLGGPLQVFIMTLILNAVVWHLVIRQRGRKDTA